MLYTILRKASQRVDGEGRGNLEGFVGEQRRTQQWQHEQLWALEHARLKLSHVIPTDKDDKYINTYYIQYYVSESEWRRRYNGLKASRPTWRLTAWSCEKPRLPPPRPTEEKAPDSFLYDVSFVVVYNANTINHRGTRK